MTTMEATAAAQAQPLHSTRAHSSALSARLWLSPKDRQRLSKLREKIASLTGRSASHSVLLRAGIASLELSADTIAIERKRQPDTKSRRELALMWWLSEAAHQVGADDR